MRLTSFWICSKGYKKVYYAGNFTFMLYKSLGKMICFFCFLLYKNGWYMNFLKWKGYSVCLTVETICKKRSVLFNSL